MNKKIFAIKPIYRIGLGAYDGKDCGSNGLDIGKLCKFSYLQTIKTITTMDYKATIIKLLVCLLVSPIIVYIFLGIAGLAGSTYEMTNGESFIIWVLMAILICLSWTKK